MQNANKRIFLSILFGLCLPWCVTLLLVENQQKTDNITESTMAAMETVQEKHAVIHVLFDGTATQMRLEDYLVGVLLGELPADFSMEAKKAQAVVARTYTLRTVQMKNKHSDHAVCTDSNCCQSYISPVQYLENGGTQSALDEATQAVQQTKDVVLTYAGQLIDATYFSCSGGTTETALAVWGSDVPYLQSVTSPGEEIAAHYTDTVKFTLQDFQSRLGVTLNGDHTSWIRDIKYTDGGGVASVTIGERTFTGTQLRSQLQLRSTAFAMTPVGNSIVITTKGFGHRVGMSQYGAQAMALSGNDYEAILRHYYSGAELEERTA